MKQGGSVHKFLVHNRNDDVGVAIVDIEPDDRVVGVVIDDASTLEVPVREAVPLGHKLAIRDRGPSETVTEYGITIGITPTGVRRGDYVHTHNLKSARW